MKQIVRRVIDRKGKVVVIDLPEPHLGSDQILVQNHYSLISSGTEMNTISKTPTELLKQTVSDPWMRHVVKQTVFATGVTQTASRVWQEMTMPREIGYSGAGRVLALGERVEGFQVGDKVAYAATGHAELVAPSINHVVSVPEEIDLRHAAFVTVGGIAIQSLRRAEIQFGEVVAVYGLGLVGQLCGRLAKAAGCIVVGIDLNERCNEMAKESGVDLVLNPSDSDWVRRVMDFTGKNGVDATIICASSKSDEIINSSMEITRKQGRVVIVGYVNLNIHPKNFLYREIDLRYSRAYGPGSYHNAYEKGRVDYPFGYVRWTEKRNLQEFIRLIGAGTVCLDPLIQNTYPVERAQDAFDAIRAGTLNGAGTLLSYDSGKEPNRRRTLEVRSRRKTNGKVGVSIVGVGNHVLGKHLPNLRNMPDVEVRGLVSATGKNASMVAEKVGATIITTDIDEVLADPDTDAVMICSSQPEHSDHLRKVIEAGKAVFVEKPLVTRLEDFAEIARLMEVKPVLFALGVNRRYSPILDKLRELIKKPVDAVTYLVSQPFVPPNHWTLDEVDGGGRLITEGEHFIDICHLLIGLEPKSVYAKVLGEMPGDLRNLCNFAITIHYEGAVANVLFDECGGAGYPRERVTVFAKGCVAILDDFARLTLHGTKKKSYGSGFAKEMGHKQILKEFVAALRNQPNRLLTWKQTRQATLCMFAAQESIRSGQPVDIKEFEKSLTYEGSP